MSSPNYYLAPNRAHGMPAIPKFEAEERLATPPTAGIRTFMASDSLSAIRDKLIPSSSKPSDDDGAQDATPDKKPPSSQANGINGSHVKCCCQTRGKKCALDADDGDDDGDSIYGSGSTLHSRKRKAAAVGNPKSADYKFRIQFTVDFEDAPTKYLHRARVLRSAPLSPHLFVQQEFRHDLAAHTIPGGERFFTVHGVEMAHETLPEKMAVRLTVDPPSPFLDYAATEARVLEQLDDWHEDGKVGLWLHFLVKVTRRVEERGYQPGYWGMHPGSFGPRAN